LTEAGALVYPWPLLFLAQAAQEGS
jgi:hypothetical protein